MNKESKKKRRAIQAQIRRRRLRLYRTPHWQPEKRASLMDAIAMLEAQLA